MAYPDYRGTRGPASVRYNNPGAMYPGPSARKFGSIGTEIIGGGHKIAVFQNAVDGAAALFDLLMNGKDTLGNYRYRNKSVIDAIRTWSGGNSVESYLKQIERISGVSRQTVLTPEFLRSQDGVEFAKAMATHEAGKTYPIANEDWLVAQKMAYAESSSAAKAPKANVPPPAQKQLRRTSRKWNLVAFLRWMFGLGSAGTVGYSFLDTLNLATEFLRPVGNFVLEFGIPLLIAVCLVGYIASQLIAEFMVEDFEEGRYDPSKDKKD